MIPFHADDKQGLRDCERNICGGNLPVVTEAAADDGAAEQRAHL